MSDLHHRLSSCSRLYPQQQSSQSVHSSSITDCHLPVDPIAGMPRLHLPSNTSALQPSGSGIQTADLVIRGGGNGQGALHSGLSTSSRSGFMTGCGPTSSYYYRPTTSSSSSSSYFRSNLASVSGLASADDDDNDVDEPVASSEEEENKPRIWSIADVATSCRSLHQRAGSLGVGLTSLGGGGTGHNGFLHPWNSVPSSSIDYSQYQSAGTQAACSAAGFYASYYHQQPHQRPVATPVARQQQLPVAPVGMATAHQQSHQASTEVVRCAQLQYPNAVTGNTFDNNRKYTGKKYGEY